MTHRPYTTRCQSTYRGKQCVVNWTNRPHQHRWWNGRGEHVEWTDHTQPKGQQR